jgi:AmiR/NasT family two-component response regulator
VSEHAEHDLLLPPRVVVTGDHSPYSSKLSESLVTLGSPVLVRELEAASAVSELMEVDSDLVVVVAGENRYAALRLIGVIRHQGKLPVVAAMERGDTEWTAAAVAAGASGAIIGSGLESLRAALHVAREHFAELRRLEQALERRAVIERAKGVLMATYGIGGEDAYILLRDHSRRTSRKLVKVANAILMSHVLLGKQPPGVEAEAAVEEPARPRRPFERTEGPEPSSNRVFGASPSG